MIDWAQLVVEDLCEHKRRGTPFHEAWRQTMADWPPTNRDRPAIEPTLFDLDELEPFLDAFYRFADDAWHGRRPHLARLQVLADPDVFPDAERVQPYRATGAQAA